MENSPIKPPVKMKVAGRRLWELVAGSQQLQPVDQAALAGLCRAWEIWLDCDKDLKKAKDLNERHKLMVLWGMSWRNVQAGCARFGITPRDRKVVKPDKTEEPGSALKAFTGSG